MSSHDSLRRKKYLVIGGEVTSKTDGQRRHVGARMLVDLYGVRLDECVLTDEQEQVHPDLNELTILRPDCNGRYELPGDRRPLMDVTPGFGTFLQGDAQ